MSDTSRPRGGTFRQRVVSAVVFETRDTTCTGVYFFRGFQFQFEIGDNLRPNNGSLPRTVRTRRRRCPRPDFWPGRYVGYVAGSGSRGGFAKRILQLFGNRFRINVSDAPRNVQICLLIYYCSFRTTLCIYCRSRTNSKIPE